MNAPEVRKAALRALAAIAPEVDPASIDDQLPLRDILDLDSMDFLNLVIALGRELKLEIPERDYSKMQTLGSLVEYLSGRQPAG